MSDIVSTYLTATMEAILEPKKDTKIAAVNCFHQLFLSRTSIVQKNAAIICWQVPKQKFLLTTSGSMIVVFLALLVLVNIAI